MVGAAGGQRRREAIEVQRVVAAGVPPGLQPARAPQRRDLVGDPRDLRLAQHRAEALGDARHVEGGRDDVAGELGCIAEDEIRSPIGDHALQPRKHLRRDGRSPEFGEQLKVDLGRRQRG